MAVRWTTNVTDVVLRYSTDGGESWEEIEPTVDDTQPGWLDYPWLIPNDPSKSCLVMVAGYKGEAPTQSRAVFEIAPTQDMWIGGCTGAGTTSGPWAISLALLLCLRRRDPPA